MVDVTKKLPLHARVGETPGWMNLRVLKDGKEFKDVVEVDVLGCWAVRYCRDAKGDLMMDDERAHVLTEKVHGFFSLEWAPEEDPLPVDYGMYGVGGIG